MTNPRRIAGDVALGFAGILVVCVAWEVTGRYKLAGPSWPALSAVIGLLIDPAQRPAVMRATTASFSRAAAGCALGTALGIGFGAMAHMTTALRPGLDRLISTINAVPAIALAPLFILLLSREYTGMAIATLSVFYITYVATTSGLSSSSASHRDFFKAFGSSKFLQLIYLDLPAAFPVLVGGLKYAVPAALLGAILGEWFGSSRGLGLMMISAMQNFQIQLLWGAMLITALGAMIAFGLLSLGEAILRGRFE
ncbi:NitT/TauT family transport system permease protein [Rhizobium sp. BK313]|uniref:ABC transporter permease n=1 Tax=Rhizobium sp. BK313 TaxID=2587081 RepID=UPI00105BF640|nr:ABC transporter permease subunit [Rhizobium sp. BK313]MBB3458310.1 NitT/TauT family transport system permease protein [Rhizobium sp. BK313]